MTAPAPRAGRVVLLAVDCEPTNILYHYLAAEFHIERVIIEPAIPRMEFVRRRMKRLGPLKVAGQVLFQLLAVPLLARSSRSRSEELKAQFGFKDSPVPPERVTHVPSVNAPETIQLLQELRPDAIVINGTRIIAEIVLKSVPCPFINIHAGITPLYRGVHGAYWALAQGQPEACGVTVHLVDPGIDTGSILEQGIIQPTPADNFTTYHLLQQGAGLSLLKKSVGDALDGRLLTRPAPAGKSHLWSHPTLAEYIIQRMARGVK